jgi:hypothetical protein
MLDTKLKYGDIPEKIIGAAFEVHKFLGNGLSACLVMGTESGGAEPWPGSTWRVAEGRDGGRGGE